MRSLSTLSLSCAALVLASAITTEADFSLPLTSNKKLNPKKYPQPDKITEEVPKWTQEYDLSGIPNIPPNVYETNIPPCAQHKPGTRNAECGEYSKEDVLECKKPNQWALTFDDGPTENTNIVLDTLDKAGGIKGTFFIVGSRLLEHPAELVEVVKAGHEIAVHTWSHPRLSSLTNGQIIAEIKWTEEAIKELIGIKPKYFRPPFGNMDDRVRFIIKAMGYTPIMWTADTMDWEYMHKDASKFKEGVEKITGNVKNYIESVKDKEEKPGAILLQHDLGELPARFTRDIVEVVRGSGYKFVPMTKCLNDKSFAQSVTIVASEPHGKITPVDVTPPPPATEPKPIPSTSTPTQTTEKAKSEPSDSRASASFSMSLPETMSVAAGVLFLALAM